MPAPLLDAMPHLRELRDAMAEPDHEDSFFRSIEAKLRNPQALQSYQRLERDFAELDDAAWADLRARAVPELVSRVRSQGRGWEQLFNVFSEARGYIYLKRIGCVGIAFMPRSKNQTPDLEGRLEGQRVLCEVKTINIAKEEVEHRQRVYRGEVYVRDTQTQVDEAFLSAKLLPTIDQAIAQLDAEDPTRTARRFVLLVMHFNDWVGDYQPEYLAQIDRYLDGSPIVGAELVIWIASNLFGREFEMRNAVVVAD